MPDQDDLPFGLYERLITASLKARLLQFDPAVTRVSTKGLDPAEAHAIHVPGPSGLRVAQGRAANRVHLATEAADAGRPLQSSKSGERIRCHGRLGRMHRVFDARLVPFITVSSGADPCPLTVGMLVI